MNDRATASATDPQQVAVDADHPWLGLASFTEETRAYFYGREEEVAELGRRVQRKLLTILFGQSGLGKTSILRAGIVPRLRPDGYCPVYVRVDYSPDSPPPSEQIKQAIFRATQASGEWSRTGVAETGESLWEFLHHRDDILRDASGKTLIPLLIFDQFEELFTLAQSDDFGRQRAAQFIEDLADLVENRAPKALEATMDDDEAAVERFDFTRSDYRILIALREDYLAHLEGLKGAMPSISQNRMRLARMTGMQALSAVMKPGGKLVSEEVAGSIVRFVAGGSELANAEVEPALLSLICRELNNARLSQGRSEISADLLAGSRDTILTEFYERALADQPVGVRQFIEDNLLTESGYRESLAEERVKKGLAAAGATPHALADLVNRRLLRIEERLDVRRVELTHDVLCGVVRASRDVRLEREARADIERKLAAQRESERATRKALVRARQIATVCGVLAILSVASAIFGYVSMKRAQVAESEAQQTRLLAESARGEAEKLVVYLLDDFYLELEPIGRLDIVAALAKRAITYYDALPAQLRTPETERNRALAMVRYGSVLRYQANLDEAKKVLTEATGVLDGLHDKGDQSEVTAIGLAMGLAAQARTADSMNLFADAAAAAKRAADLLASRMAAAVNPSVALRRAYGAVMIYRGFSQQQAATNDAAIKSLEAARDAYRSIDNLSLADLNAAAGYAEASAWLMSVYASLQRQADVIRVGNEALPVTDKILQQRPAHMGAHRARGLMSSTLAEVEADTLHPTKSLVYGEQAIRDWEAFLQLDPGNGIAWNNLAANYERNGESLQALGRIDDSRAKLLTAGAMEQRAKMSSSFAVNLMFPTARLAALEADTGNLRAADAAVANIHRLAAIARRTQTPAQRSVRTLDMLETGMAVAPLDAAGDYQGVRRMLLAVLPEAGFVPPTTGRDRYIWDINMVYVNRALAEADYKLNDFAAAEKAIRVSIAHGESADERTIQARRLATQSQVLLAMTLARQNRLADAQQVIAPALKFQRDLRAQGGEDLQQRIELAQALYASALANPGNGRPALAEAAALIDALPQTMRSLRSTLLVRKNIADEQARRRS